MSEANFCKAVIMQAIKGKNKAWFEGNNSPLSYSLVHSILSWLPIDGRQAYKNRQQIKRIINHTLSNTELYIISQSQDITETAKQLKRSYQTISAAKKRLEGILCQERD